MKYKKKRILVFVFLKQNQNKIKICFYNYYLHLWTHKYISIQTLKSIKHIGVVFQKRIQNQ